MYFGFCITWYCLHVDPEVVNSCCSWRLRALANVRCDRRSICDQELQWMLQPTARQLTILLSCLCRIWHIHVLLLIRHSIHTLYTYKGTPHSVKRKACESITCSPYSLNNYLILPSRLVPVRTTLFHWIAKLGENPEWKPSMVNPWFNSLNS